MQSTRKQVQAAFRTFTRPGAALLGAAVMFVPMWVVAHDDPVIREVFVDPGEVCFNPAYCGKVGPLIPTHVTATHSAFTWKYGADTPKVLSFFRFPDMQANDVVLTERLARLIHEAVPPFTQRAFNDPSNNFNAAYNRGFIRVMYGDYNIVQGLSQSVPTRIRANQNIELSQLWNWGHGDAFAVLGSGKIAVANLTEADFARNAPAFSAAGYSRGLRYNLYCTGHSALEDGRIVYAGGHDMNSNNGLYKINVWNPETEDWAPRAQSCQRAVWETKTPEEWESWALNPANAGQYAPGCPDPHTTLANYPFGPTVTQPADRSDMRYARWYPTAVTLPNNRVLVFNGTDSREDMRETPGTVIDATTGDLRLPTYASSDRELKASTINQAVPEIYDPATDRTVALENARMLHPFYSHAFPVHTGPGPNDWKLFVTNGEAPSSVCQRAEAGELGSFRCDPTPERWGKGVHPAQKYEMSGRPLSGKSWFLDVNGALDDPGRNVPGEKFYTYVDTAKNEAGTEVSTAPYFPTVQIKVLGTNGRLSSHKVVSFGAMDRGGTIYGTVNMIELMSAKPKWIAQEPLYQPARFAHAVVLPDGTVFVSDGKAPGATYEQRNSLYFQIFDPATSRFKRPPASTDQRLAKTTVPRGIHANVIIGPDARPVIMGHDRPDLVLPGDIAWPSGDPDLGVPNAQVYDPPYLFKNDRTPAVRPTLAAVPKSIRYQQSFSVEVNSAAGIKSVSMIRTGATTHSLTPDWDYVKLPFVVNAAQKSEGAGAAKLTILPPSFPAQAIAGDWMLFVVDKNGVPSVGRHVRLKRQPALPL